MSDRTPQRVRELAAAGKTTAEIASETFYTRRRVQQIVQAWQEDRMKAARFKPKASVLSSNTAVFEESPHVTVFATPAYFRELRNKHARD